MVILMLERQIERRFYGSSSSSIWAINDFQKKKRNNMRYPIQRFARNRLETMISVRIRANATMLLEREMAKHSNARKTGSSSWSVFVQCAHFFNVQL